MTISNVGAALAFRAQAASADAAGAVIDQGWVVKIEQLSRLCELGGSTTHIAFLGTSILAKAVSSTVDLFAIKPRHSSGNPNAYSARTLCHKVLVPLAAELGVDIGVSGREPLNNQPYFRMSYLGDGTPVHSRAVPAFNYMIGLVDELQQSSSDIAVKALQAFIRVRKSYHKKYEASEGEVIVDRGGLAQAIQTLVADDSEGGRRAQAAAAGLFDVFAGPNRVESGRINDPSRHYPGDVAIRNLGDGWEKAIEVRDKPVTESDVFIFGRSCQQKGAREAGLVLASLSQRRLDDAEIRKWATRSEIGLSLFYGWNDLVEEVLFWAPAPTPEAVALAVGYIELRLISIQASTDSVKLWQALTRAE